jgi:hypothetical protein
MARLRILRFKRQRSGTFTQTTDFIGAIQPGERQRQI